jgi:acyl carrier protein
VLPLVIEAIRHLSRRGTLPKDLADRALAGDTPIDALGIDSLGKLDLLSELEERADMTLSESMILGLRTLEDIAHMLDAGTP